MSAISINYKRHLITVERERPGVDWYITVECPGGGMAYDGWWRDSAYKSHKEAIEEAKRGALLIREPSPPPAGKAGG